MPLQQHVCNGLPRPEDESSWQEMYCLQYVVFVLALIDVKPTWATVNSWLENVWCSLAVHHCPLELYSYIQTLICVLAARLRRCRTRSNPVLWHGEWRLIPATLCEWRRCFLADQLWFMTRTRTRKEDWSYTQIDAKVM